jgi:hypothetical protein
MIFGDKNEFAIECEIREIHSEKWVFAYFRLWANNTPIGDYDDSMDLLSGARWLKTFLNCPDGRSESSLDDKDAEEVFSLIFDSVMLTVPKGSSLKELLEDVTPPPDSPTPLYPNIINRFHLDQVGMSSFMDKWNVILVDTANKSQRLIWRNLDDMKILEANLPAGKFEEISKMFLRWVDSIK